MFFKNEIQVNAAAADLIISLTARTNKFLLALSGGVTPLKLYRMLAKDPCKKKIKWANIHFFFSDERMVPPDNRLSNFFSANEYLFKKLMINEKQIHRIKGELSAAETASDDYEKRLKKFFDLPEEAMPVFDLILLGLGIDGHTASLFPGDKAVCEKNHLAIHVEHPITLPIIPRVTMTLPVLNSANNVLFLVNQANKEQILDRILNHEFSNPETTCPAAMIKPQGNLFWYIQSKRAENDSK